MRHYRVESFERLIEAFNALPTIGKKSATKLAYYIVSDGSFQGLKLAQAIEDAVSKIRKCQRCHSICEDELCGICSDESRDHSKLCIVQSAKDIFTIESLGQYDGLYYILSSIEELDEVHLESIVDGIEEIIFAFPPGIATETMILFIQERLKHHKINFSKIAQGVPTGVELDSVDLPSLSRALEDRIFV